jgi:hypothetical protein
MWQKPTKNRNKRIIQTLNFTYGAPAAEQNAQIEAVNKPLTSNGFAAWPFCTEFLF